MRNIRLVIAYDGTAYQGFQKQPYGSTVQSELEKALEKFLREPVRIIGASRTDAGVHAVAQVVNFETGKSMPVARVKASLNGILPPDIKASKVEEADPDFHARRDATAREYEYYIWNADFQNVFRRDYAYHVPEKLDRKAMAEAVGFIEGTHDFKAFCVAESAVKGCVRTVYSAVLKDEGDHLLTVYIKANSFVHQMVRSIIGTVVEVGLGKRDPGSIMELLENRDRSSVGKTAPARGLFLTKIEYRRTC